jgi:Polysaccharide biosynthesis/export protein
MRRRIQPVRNRSEGGGGWSRIEVNDRSQQMVQSRALLVLSMALSLAVGASAAADAALAAPGPASTVDPPINTATSYVLGPDDVIAIKALDADEVNSPSVRVDQTGFISLPCWARVMAGGLTAERLEKELTTRLKTYVRAPVVAVSVVDYRSQPVSVIGSVGAAGRAPAGRAHPVHPHERREECHHSYADNRDPGCSVCNGVQRHLLRSAVENPHGALPGPSGKLKPCSQALVSPFQGAIYPVGATLGFQSPVCNAIPRHAEPGRIGSNLLDAKTDCMISCRKSCGDRCRRRMRGSLSSRRPFCRRSTIHNGTTSRYLVEESAMKSKAAIQ